MGVWEYGNLEPPTANGQPSTKTMKRYIVIVLLLVSQIAQAQIKKSAEIRNEEGAVISGATIHVLNTDIYVLSNSAGRFSIPVLPQGIYPVEISSVGYARI